ncbi:hypothetical protein VPNG_09999 [Cytospora leucostoma]|uniref:Swi5-domain-containing protein n=1 Tax=Cytospora leucostoma TaxID=1230097 RepID=A0A423VG68_9PEZI|nr:hypothetical protein VPNG_09999 [Cytospora leucostoma]
MSPTRAASGELEGDAPLENGRHGLTLLSAADIDFIDGFRNACARNIVEGHDLGGLLQAVSAHLDRFENEVRRVGSQEVDNVWPISQLLDPWGPIVSAKNVLHPNTIEISGPCVNDHFEVVVSNAGKAVQTAQYVTGIDAAFRRLTDIRGRCLQLGQKQHDLDHEQKSLRQTAETTVNDHIRLLRQYNKMKDVGQQVIGLIAENRGVPIGSLYADQEYGVGPGD